MATRRIGVGVLALFAVAVLMGAAVGRRDGPPAGAQSGAELTLFFDTHMHGSLTGANDVTLAHYVGLLKQRRAAAGPNLWLGAGDDLGASQMSSIFKGAQMVEAFNEGGLDANTIGNHDFDYGPDNFLAQVQASRFTWLSANVIDRRTGDVFGAEAGVRRMLVKDAGGISVGLTGISWSFLSSTNAGPNVEIRDQAAALAEVVPQLRAAGAAVVVVMAHECGPVLDELAARISGVDVILGDHCAVRLSQPRQVNGVILVRRGDELRALGELTLRLDGGRVAGFSYQDYDVTKDVPEDAAVKAVIDRYRARLDQELLQEAGRSAIDLDALTETVRRGESNLGNYIADALRAWRDADVAITNGGGIRGNKIYSAGPITRGDTVTMLPFNNTAVLLRLTGADILAAVENGLSGLPAASGRFPHVSGMSFVYDPSAEAGARVVELLISGAPVDSSRRYTLATNDFMAGGGDGYEVFKSAEVLVAPQAGPLLYDLLAAAIARDGVIAPALEGRIRMK